MTYSKFYCTLLGLWLGTQCLLAQHTDTTQNLVINGGFETYTSPPNAMGDITHGIVPHWQANPKESSPEYFHAKGRRGFRVPKNKCGYMHAHSGEGYAGVLVRAGAKQMDKRDVYYREHLMTKLKRPMRAKYRYVVSFYVALASYSNYAVANMGVYFNQYPEQIKWDTKYEVQIDTPKERFFDQPNRWVLVQDTMVAIGGEQYIMIGDFNDYKHRQIKKISNSRKHRHKFNFNRAYYYIDDVSVVELDKFEIQTIPNITLTRKHPPNKVELKTNLGKISKGKPVVLQNIFFEFAKARLLPESFPELDKLVGLLKKYPQINMRIMGHTDNVGTNERNLKLSEQRARSVVNYLVKKGIKATRLKFKGFGESHPIDSNATKEGRQKNRRVEFVVL